METFGTISDLIAHLLANRIQMNAKLPKHVIVVPFGLPAPGLWKNNRITFRIVNSLIHVNYVKGALVETKRHR